MERHIIAIDYQLLPEPTKTILASVGRLHDFSSANGEQVARNSDAPLTQAVCAGQRGSGINRSELNCGLDFGTKVHRSSFTRGLLSTLLLLSTFWIL